MSALHSLALASLLALGSGAQLGDPVAAVSTGPMNAAVSSEAPAGPGLQLDLFQSHGIVAMPETPCGYQMMVLGLPGEHFQVEVRPSGQPPMMIGSGVIGEDGSFSLSLLPIWCEHGGDWISARVVSFATAPIAVKLEMF